MTTRQRIDLLAGAYPREFPRLDLQRLMRSQLGDVDALDSWIEGEGVRLRARAPRVIYHVCAGNLAISACTSLVHGLLLGAHNVVKLPAARENSSTRREILAFIHGLPDALRSLVTTHAALNTGLLRTADAVVAFGSDATMASLRAYLPWNRKFVPHGHAVSLLWISDPNRLTSAQAQACARDILSYDQLGCLSPQAIYLPRGSAIQKLGEKLTCALEEYWRCLTIKPERTLPIAARITEARDVAHAQGHRMWLPPERHLGWTLIHDPDPTFAPSPLHGVIFLREIKEGQLPAALAAVAGSISTVGVAGALTTRHRQPFLDLGVTRFCPAGRMQFPPLAWHHDGTAPLAELVSWIDNEIAP